MLSHIISRTMVTSHHCLVDAIQFIAYQRQVGPRKMLINGVRLVQRQQRFTLQGKHHPSCTSYHLLILQSSIHLAVAFKKEKKNHSTAASQCDRCNHSISCKGIREERKKLNLCAMQIPMFPLQIMVVLLKGEQVKNARKKE